MRQNNEPPVIAICGVKNSGKTTCMEGLISILSKQGYHVAAIKHDGHDFQADVPGTDSYRMQQAGAFGTAVFSENRVLIYKETRTDIGALISCFPESDLILVEGMKDTELLKLEIIRQGISKEPVSNPKGRIGILTDREELLEGADGLPKEVEEMQVFNLNDLSVLADFLADMIRRENKNG